MEEARGTDSTGSGQLNYFNITNSSYCTDLSAKDIYGLKVTYFCVSSAAGVACILAIIFILVSKRYKKFVYRLTLYLMVAILLVEVMNILGVVPVYHNGTTVVVRGGFEGLCVSAGFLYQVAFWMELLVIFWIVLYLLMILVFNGCSATGVKQEACGVTAVLIFPFLLNWIPFVNGMYGRSGPLCWIKKSVNSNCEYDDVGLALMFSLLHGPVFFITMVVLISFAAIAVVMCRKVTRQRSRMGQPSIHQQGLKELLPLFLYLIIHFVLWVAGVVLRICDAVVSAQDRTPPHSLLVVHHTIINAKLLLIPLICLLHLSMSYCRKKQQKQRTLTTTTCYIVPNEFTDQEDDLLIIRGNNTAIPSKEYKSVFEGNEQ